MLYKNILLILPLILFLVSCSLALPTASGETNITTEQGYPTIEKENNLEAKIIVNPSLGTVNGRILLKGKPINGVTLGLAKVLTDESGLEIATSFDRINSPQTDTQKDGSFIFENIEPGRYGLIYANLPDTYLLLIPGNSSRQQAVLVTVNSGEKSDLGILDFDSLPEAFE